MAATRKKKFVVALTATSVLAITGVGVAYWTANGSGSGTAATGTSQSVIITQTSAPTGLGPETGTQPLSGTFTTGDDKPTFVEQVTATVTGTNKVGCGPTDYLIGQPTVTHAQVVSNDAWGGGTIEFVNKATNQDACKDATVNISYTSN